MVNTFQQLVLLLSPEIVVTTSALAVLALDLFALPELAAGTRRLLCAVAVAAGSLVAAGWAVAIVPEASLSDGMLVLNPGSSGITKAVILVLTAAAGLLAVDCDFSRHVGEFYAVLLMGTVGFMLLVSSENLLVIFLALELSSICLYILTAFSRDLKASEAALKYFLFGGMAAAFTLFGISLLYGISGSLNFPVIARCLAARAGGTTTLDPLVITAFVMTVVGFGFKVAAAPFHLWAPDVYEGAPLPSAALIASGSKVAGFFVIATVMTVCFAGTEGTATLWNAKPGWLVAFAAIAATSMVVGNLAALVQTNVRRLLAYSAIAHAGYLLLGVMAPGMNGFRAVIYYAATYAFATLGAFGVISLVRNQAGDDDLASLRGLGRRSPAVAACLSIFILSLAGIPPLPGFFAKFYVFAAALKDGHPAMSLLWLVVLAVAASAVSLYYYLKILKEVYFRPQDHVQAVLPRTITTWVVAALALAVLLSGIFPQWALSLIH